MKKIILKSLLIMICLITTSFKEPVIETSKYQKDISEIKYYLNEAKKNLKEAKLVEIDTINKIK